MLAGAVTLVATKDKVLAVDTVGYADVAAKKPMEKDAVFWIASMNKPITCAALMILVDEGKIAVDDPVEKYLPEFKGQWVIDEQSPEKLVLKKPVHPITIKNVLSHTAGLDFRSGVEQPTLDQLPLAARVRSYAMVPLLHQPDSKYKYSNEGINIGGRIIEVVSGMSYEAFLDERLFQPLGMKDTTFWPSGDQLTRLAKSYQANKDKSDIQETTVGQLKYPLDDRTRQPMPGGGLFSTAGDLVKFCQMLLNGGQLGRKRYLSEAAIKVMTSRQTPAKLKESYGFGFSIGGDGSYGHGGAYSTNMNIDPTRGLITIFMVQNAGWRNDSGKGIQGVFVKAAQEMVSTAR
ncbi:MAG TPA: serine hydrolase domain-containing protein [Verrucomicrobium sp.]|nr:serine hydrolase domain-containing protein [Verrucomicrobium sp.]